MTVSETCTGQFLCTQSEIVCIATVLFHNEKRENAGQDEILKLLEVSDDKVNKNPRVIICLS